MPIVISDNKTTPPDTGKVREAAAELRRLKERLENAYLDIVAQILNELEDKPDQVFVVNKIASQGQVDFDIGTQPFSTVTVFINGVYQDNTAYYRTGSVFTFTEPLNEGDKVTVMLGAVINTEEKALIATYTVVASLAQPNNFPLPATYVSNDALVFVNGVKQAPGNAYTIGISNTLDFVENLNEGDVVDSLVFMEVQSQTTMTKAITLCEQKIVENTLIPVGYNAFSVDPTIESGVTVTVSEGSTWAIIGGE